MSTSSKAARAGSYSLRSATTQSTWLSSTPRSVLSLRPFSSPTREKSTAVTDQPRSASQTELRPSPAARSSARPGGRSASSAATNLFGYIDHSNPAPEYRSSHCCLSTRPLSPMTGAAGKLCRRSHRGRLTRPVRPEEAEDLAGRDAERQPGQRDHGPEPAAQPDQLKRRPWPAVSGRAAADVTVTVPSVSCRP